MVSGSLSCFCDSSSFHGWLDAGLDGIGCMPVPFLWCSVWLQPIGGVCCRSINQNQVIKIKDENS